MKMDQLETNILNLYIYGPLVTFLSTLSLETFQYLKEQDHCKDNDNTFYKQCKFLCKA